MLRELMGINSSKDAAIYEHIIRMLAELRDAWEQVRKSALQLPSVSMESEFRNWQAMA
jgi:flagellin-specific chaperone FliS